MPTTWLPQNTVLTVPSHEGQSFDGNGVWIPKQDGRCTNSARLSAMASATDSAVGLSPLFKNTWNKDNS